MAHLQLVQFMWYEHFRQGSVSINIVEIHFFGLTILQSNLRDTGTSLNRAPISLSIQIEITTFTVP